MWQSKTLLATSFIAAGALVMLTACSPKENALQQSAKKLGVDNIKTIEFSGTGTWYQFGQSPAPGTAWPAFAVSSYTATINYETSSAHVLQSRKQVIEPNRERPVPVEQKPDQYISGSAAWNVAAPQGASADAAPAPQNQPAAVEERAAEMWTTPQGFLKAALANNATIQKEEKASKISFKLDKNDFVGTVNSDGLLEKVQTWIYNPVLGDTLIEVSFTDYKEFNGVFFPTHIVKNQGGFAVLDLNISNVTPNAAADIQVPAEIKDSPVPKAVVTSDELAPGVFYLKGGTHHSIAIDQKDHIVVVESPLNEERSDAVIAKAKELIPNKPIKYIVNTHQHFDHSGGLRTYVDEGSTIVTHELNRPFYEVTWKQPHTLRPDRLSASNKTPEFQTFSDKFVLNDGTRSIEIHQLAANGHNDAFAFVYLPAEKILIEADAFTPPAPDAPAPTSVNPYAKNLYDNIQRLNLDVDQIAPLHGRLVKIDDLRSFIGVTKS